MITAKRAKVAKRTPYFRTQELPRAVFALFAIFAVNLGPAAGRQGSTVTGRLPFAGPGTHET